MGAKFSDLIEAALREARKRAVNLPAQPGNGRSEGATVDAIVAAAGDETLTSRTADAAERAQAEPAATASGRPSGAGGS